MRQLEVLSWLRPIESHGDDDQTQTTLQLPSSNPTMLVSLTVGKVDAGVAVLLTEDKRLVSPIT